MSFSMFATDNLSHELQHIRHPDADTLSELRLQGGDFFFKLLL